MDILVSDKELRIKDYERRKQALSEKLKNSTTPHQSIRLDKSTTNLFRERVFNAKRINTRKFNHVISIDRLHQTADIEGMATYETIVKATLAHGFMPAVVPELKTITIGGALAGCGIESSSFKFGLSHESMLEYDVLLADGRIVTCNPHNEHRALYYAFPNSYGTLGYALRVKVKLVPVKPYVKLTHLHFNNPKDFFSALETSCRKHTNNGSVSFIDGVVFNTHKCVLTLGEFVDEALYTSDYKYLNIYYKSLNSLKRDYLSTEDYIWRWDTDWFWCSKNFMMQNFFMRLLFGKLVLNSKTYNRLRKFFTHNKLASKLANWKTGPIESVIQDVEIPIHNAENFLAFFEKEIGIHPIWICPIIPQNHALYDLYKMTPNQLYVNFGFWDMLPSKEIDGFYNRKIEEKVSELDGIKSLYSRVYYSQKEFWDLYDKRVYDKLKTQYDPKNRLGNLYDKCKGKA